MGTDFSPELQLAFWAVGGVGAEDMGSQGSQTDLQWPWTAVVDRGIYEEEKEINMCFDVLLI